MTLYPISERGGIGLPETGTCASLEKSSEGNGCVSSFIREHAMNWSQASLSERTRPKPCPLNLFLNLFSDSTGLPKAGKG